MAFGDFEVPMVCRNRTLAVATLLRLMGL